MSETVDMFGASRYGQVVPVAEWGPQEPKLYQDYRGYMIVALSTFGEHQIIDYDFRRMPDSPWLLQHMRTYLAGLIATGQMEACQVYRWQGKFRMFKKSIKFDGGLIPVDCGKQVSVGEFDESFRREFMSALR